MSHPVDIRCFGSELVCNAAYEAMLRRNGLLDHDRVMAMTSGTVIKQAVPERTTVRFAVGPPDCTDVYLKRHRPVSFMRYIRHWVTCLKPPTTARDEFDAIVAFQLAGLPTMTPLAAGIRRRGAAGCESFLLTKAIENTHRLDHYFSQYPPAAADEKRQTIKELALLVKRMHDAGFNHRDLYLCHILRTPSAGLYIVDLHRAEKRGSVPLRLKVKDIAALQYSAPRGLVSRTDRLRFILAYFDTDGLGRRQKRFVFRVLKKVQKMVQHTEKQQQRAGRTNRA